MSVELGALWISPYFLESDSSFFSAHQVRVITLLYATWPPLAVRPLATALGALAQIILYCIRYVRYIEITLQVLSPDIFTFKFCCADCADIVMHLFAHRPSNSDRLFSRADVIHRTSVRVEWTSAVLYAHLLRTIECEGRSARRARHIHARSMHAPIAAAPSTMRIR